MDDEGEFESGYAGTEAAEKPPVVDPVVEATEPEGKEEPVQELPKADPLQEMRDLIEKQNTRIRNTEGHIGGLNHNLRQMQETLTASKAASQQVSDAPTQAMVKEAMSNPKEWDELKTDFPEWATATEKFMDSKLSQVSRVNPDDISKLEQQMRGANDALRQELIESRVEESFPDWKADVNTPAFAEWSAKQGAEVTALAASPKVADALKMLKLFHASKAIPASNAATRQKRIEAAVTPKGSGGFSQSKSDMDEFESGYSGR